MKAKGKSLISGRENFSPFPRLYRGQFSQKSGGFLANAAGMSIDGWCGEMIYRMGYPLVNVYSLRTWTWPSRNSGFTYPLKMVIFQFAMLLQRAYLLNQSFFWGSNLFSTVSMCWLGQARPCLVAGWCQAFDMRVKNLANTNVMHWAGKRSAKPKPDQLGVR